MVDKYNSFVHFQVNNHNVIILPRANLDADMDILSFFITEEDVEEVIAHYPKENHVAQVEETPKRTPDKKHQ